eukprot:COSAG02_NODE_152_length_33208_cov_13.316591_39_plen_248_part_00
MSAWKRVLKTPYGRLCADFGVSQAVKQAKQDREEEERKAKAARKEARRAARLAARDKALTVSPSPSPVAGATQSWDSTDTRSVSVNVDKVNKGIAMDEDEDEEDDDEDDEDAAALRASLELAAQLQAEDFDARVPKRKRAPPETFVAEPSKQMKTEASPKEQVRMREESVVGTEDAQSAEDDMDMIALSSDDESFSSEMQQPKAKKARREKKPKVLTEAEHAAEVMPSLFSSCACQHWYGSCVACET